MNEMASVISSYSLHCLTDGDTVNVTDRHTKVGRTQLINDLVVEHPKKKIILDMDNLDTHKLVSLYEAFQPEEVRRIPDRLETHYTLKT